MARKKTNQKSFHYFVDVWNTLVEVPTLQIPQVHADIIQYLEESDTWLNDTAVLELWRGVGKSTLVGLYIVWKLVHNPKLQFLIISASEKQAKKTVVHCKSIITRHPLAEHLRPESDKKERAQWSSTAFSVTGAMNGRERSVSCLGIDSRGTGSRCNFLIFDDVETRDTAGTDEKYDRMLEEMVEAANFLTPKGKKLFIGTPWATDTIYEAEVANGASQLKIPLIKDIQGEFPHYTGTSNWPNRFNDAHIAKLQKTKGQSKANFLAQYQLVPAQDAECQLDPNLLIKYDEEIQVTTFMGKPTYKINGEQLVGVSAFYDPAMNKAKSDDAVLAIVYTDAKGNYYIHRTFKILGDLHRQCEQIRKYVIAFGLPSVTVENNGIGASVGTVLKPYLKSIGCAVLEEYTSTNKMQKITGVFEVPLGVGAMHVSKHVYEPSIDGSKFVSQMRSYSGKERGKDDYIDAVSMAMLSQPVRLGRGAMKYDGQVDSQWRSGNDGFDYQTDDIVW